MLTVTVNYPVPVIKSARVTVTVTPVPNGQIRVNIAAVKVLGINVAFLVRAKALAAIKKLCSAHPLVGTVQVVGGYLIIRVSNVAFGD